MADVITELEEEEFTSQLTAPVFKRILELVKPYWIWVVGFVITIVAVSALDAYFTCKLLLHRAELPPERDREVVVTCEHGQRAAIAKGLVSLYGFQNAEFLEGFLEGRREAGLPLEVSS